MIIIGLTGSIATGKSFAALLFRRLHIPVFDADKEVHQLLEQKGKAAEKVATLFPDVVCEGKIDRILLGKKVFADAKQMAVLESILHPLVRKRKNSFLKQARRQKKPLVVLDIPLLFETGFDGECHHIAVTSAPDFLQCRRACARSGMTEQKFRAIKKKQMSDAKKRSKADIILFSSLGKAVTFRTIKTLVQKCRKQYA